MIRSQNASSVSRNEWNSSQPAVLTRISIGPSSRSTRAVASCTESASVTSRWTASAASATASSAMSPDTTRCPAAARAATIARPIPPAPFGPDELASALVLTFDNLGEASALERGEQQVPTGRDPSVTRALPWLLDELDRHGLKATFFVEAINCELYPDAVAGIAARAGTSSAITAGATSRGRSFRPPTSARYWPGAWAPTRPSVYARAASARPAVTSPRPW